MKLIKEKEKSHRLVEEDIVWILETFNYIIKTLKETTEEKYNNEEQNEHIMQATEKKLLKILIKKLENYIE